MTQVQETIVYGFTPVEKEYYGTEIARPCPVTEAVLHYPVNTTTIEPPPPLEGKAIVWDGVQWIYVDDHRGKPFYKEGSSDPVGYINYLTDILPEGASFTQGVPVGEDT